MSLRSRGAPGTIGATMSAPDASSTGSSSTLTSGIVQNNSSSMASSYNSNFGVDVEGGAGGGAANGTGGGVGSWSPSAPPKPAPSTAMYSQAALINTVGGLLLSLMVGDGRYAVVVITLCINGLIFSRYLSDWLLSKDDGTVEMRTVSDPIREGSQAFLRVQYTAIARLAVVVAGIIFLSYQLRPSHMGGGVQSLSSTLLGVIGAVSFVIGALCSAAAGYVSMHIAAQTNIRVASAARRNYQEALAICFRGGAFSAILVLAMCVLGVTSLYTFLHVVFVLGGSGLTSGDVPMLCVGYGFGASFVALFMQLGGGIYTKVRANSSHHQ